LRIKVNEQPDNPGLRSKWPLKLWAYANKIPRMIYQTSAILNKSGVNYTTSV